MSWRMLYCTLVVPRKGPVFRRPWRSLRLGDLYAADAVLWYRCVHAVRILSIHGINVLWVQHLAGDACHSVVPLITDGVGSGWWLPVEEL